MIANSIDSTYYSSIPLRKSYLLLFIFWPFLALVSGVLNYHQREARLAVYFFIIYYGLTFVIGDVFSDSARYALSLHEYSNYSIIDFLNRNFGGGVSGSSLDFLEPLITFLVSRFTKSTNILFAVYAAIYGFFYIKSINLLFSKLQLNSNINTVFVLLIFAAILPISNINGFRMWTASWMFFYGAYHVVINKNKKFLFVTFFSVLVHWSFLSANAILLIYLVMGNRNLLYLILVVASFIIPQLMLPYFEKVAVIFGGGVQSRYEMYTNEMYVIARQSASANNAWFMILKDQLLFYFLVFYIIKIYIYDRFKDIDNGIDNLFSFMLLFLAFINFAKTVPSFGGRFQIVFYLLAMLHLFLFFVKKSTKSINPLLIIGLIPMLLYSIVEFRQGAVTINAFLFLPGFGVPLLNSNITLAELIF